MKLLKALLAGTIALSMTSCFGPNLIYKKEMPKFTPIEGKARIVIIRPVPSFSITMGGTSDPNYLIAAVFADVKYMSETYKSTVISFPVEPGERYIFSKIPGFGMHPTGKVKFNCQAGKVYYLEEKVQVSKTPVGEVQACLLDPISIDEANKLLAEKKDLQYAEFDATKPGKDIDEKEFKSLQEDYAKWAAKKPEDAKKESDYPGY